MQETWVPSLGREDPLGKGMATHSNTLVWEIPWTEEPGDIQFRKLERVGHERAASTLYLYFGYACVLSKKNPEVVDTIIIPSSHGFITK